MPDIIGRQEAVGFGIEATPGTAVAPQIFTRHLKNSFMPKATKITNESAMGRVEKVNDSAVDQVWSEGSIEGKLQDISAGYLLTSILGPAVTTDNADTNPVVKDHTFDVAQVSNPSKYLTVAVKNPVADRRFALGVVDELEISFKSGEWTTFTAAMKSKGKATATNTVAYIDENEFTGRHVTAKVAANVAGLGAAPAIDVISGKLTITRKSKPYFPLGSADPTAMQLEPLEVTGELVLRYGATTMEDLWYADTKQAFSLQFQNTDVTIGASAKPTLLFTAPQVSLSEFDRSDDLDEVIEQTVGIQCQLNSTAGYLIRAVLTNIQAAYTA